jgi:EpsD family peptidyl-prolyl cis-trans isomerase
MNYPGRISLLAATLSLLLGACGEKPAATAAAAIKVNGEAIGAVEIEAKLQSYAHLPAEQKQSVTHTILTSFADSELLRQAALREKLDADPALQARLAGATRLIMANAYIEKTLAAAAKPNAAEIKAYYEQHPDRYAQRKRYELRELIVLGSPAVLAEVDAKAVALGDLDKLGAWLLEKKIPHNEQPLSVTSEQVLESVLEKLRPAQGGEIIRLPGEDKMTVLWVNKVEAQPLPLEQASAVIAGQLLEQRQGEAMKQAMKTLRDKAKIEYLPPYQAPKLAAH